MLEGLSGIQHCSPPECCCQLEDPGEIDCCHTAVFRLSAPTPYHCTHFSLLLFPHLCTLLLFLCHLTRSICLFLSASTSGVTPLSIVLLIYTPSQCNSFSPTSCSKTPDSTTALLHPQSSPPPQEHSCARRKSSLAREQAHVSRQYFWRF